MSHTLTEADTFTPTITVPDGSDPGSNRSGDVEAIAQALANRTKNLNDHGAKFDATNTWEQPQNIDIDQADSPFLRTTKDAGDHAGSPANIWKSQFEWLLTDGTYARLYSGAGGVDGNWLLTTNAEWHPGAAQQYWTKDDDAVESNVLRAFNGELHWYGKAAGAGSWTSSGWDTTRGVMRVGDQLHANGGLVAPDEKFLYEGVVPHWVQLYPEGGMDTFNDRMRLSSGEHARYRLRVPTGALIGQVNVKLQAYGSNYAIELHKIVSKDYSDTSSPGNTQTVEDSMSEGGGVTGVFNEILNYPAQSVDNEFTTYWVVVMCSVGSPGDIDVWSAQIGFTDPGPRNH